MNGRTARLRALLRRRVDAAAAEALTKNAAPDEQVLVDIERLSRLTALAHGADMGRRWPIVLLVCLLMAGLFGLTYPVRETHVSMDVSATEVVFKVPDEQLLVEGAKITKLRVSGVHAADLPREGAGVEHVEASAEDAADLRLAVDGQGNSLLLERLTASGAEVTVSVLDDGRVRLRVAPPPQLAVSMVGTVGFTFGDRPGEARRVTGPRGLDLEPRGREVTVDLTVAGDGGARFTPRLPVTGLDFAKVTTHSGIATTLVHRTSAIAAGGVILRDFRDREIRFQAGEPLRITGARGELQSLRMEKGMLEMKFQGMVDDLETGSAAYPRRLMPSLMEWYLVNDLPRTAWGALVAAVGTGLALRRWWSAPS